MPLLPREKIAAQGPSDLEDHELLSLILSRGTKRENIFQLTQRLCRHYDRERLIALSNVASFQKEFQLGNIQTMQLMAAIELGKRLFQPKSSTRQLQSTNDVYELLRSMQYLKKEHVRGLYLNTRNRVIHDEIISIGSLDANILHPREIFRPAMEYAAYAVIIAHNHPSGDPHPSAADLDITQKLLQAATLLQIPLLDHIVIGKDAYFSFHQEGLLNAPQ